MNMASLPDLSLYRPELPADRPAGGGTFMKNREMDYFTALYEVARVINASLDPSRVLEKIVRCVVDSIRVKACSLPLLDSRKQKLVMGAAYGLSRRYVQKGPVLLEESGLDQKAMKGIITRRAPRALSIHFIG